ncbi:MAG: hypothetical protein M1828_002582 [Chrysothrix sp. TS-e1954]|nr:MAG: hypothetical protein M1828_002582 [Chrysothrix sp. TS-e1954]
MEANPLHGTTAGSSDSESESSQLNLRPDEEWQDVESDTEQLDIVSFFDDQVFHNARDMLEHCKKNHNFDFLKVVRDFDLEFYDCIKLVNYVRWEVKNGMTRPDVSTKSLWTGEDYLQPALEDDALLFCLDEVLDQPTTSGQVEETDGGLVDSDETSSKAPDATLSRVTQLEQQLSRLHIEYTDYRTSVAQTLDQRWSERDDKTTDKASGEDDDKHYFESYANNGIHETMLRDVTRTSSYMTFIYNQKPLFASSTILDVGCGTSILSLFCARAGNPETKVYAIDASDIIARAKEIVATNALSDRITCVKGDVEDNATLPELAHLCDQGGKADILISEWMGYALLYESMLPSLLHARDTYLKPNGLICPSHTTLCIAPVYDPDYAADTFGFWGDVYGFDMRAMLTDDTVQDVDVRHINKKNLLSPGSRFKTLDLYTIQKEDLWFTESFSTEISSPPEQTDDATIDASADRTLTGFAIWFDTFFLPTRDSVLPTTPASSLGAPPTPKTPAADGTRVADDGGVAFTTGLLGPETHWKQAYLAIDRRRMRKETVVEAGMQVKGTVEYRRREVGGSERKREVEIVVGWEVVGTEERGEQRWLLR